MNGTAGEAAWKRAAWTVLFAAAAGWYVWTFTLAPLRGEPYRSALHGNDFKHLYLGAWMLSEGMNPYDAEALLRTASLRGFGAVNPYVYLPFTGLAMRPLAALDPGVALRTWFALNHLFVLAGAALALWSLGARRRIAPAAAFLTVLALCHPLLRTLTAGQLNAALFFCYAAVFALDRARRPALAGAVAAFAFLLKLAPGILFAWFLWRGLTQRGEPARRRWAGLAAMGVASAALFGVSVLWVGWDVHAGFLPLLRRMGYGSSTWDAFGMAFYRDPWNQSLNAFWHHALAAAPGSGVAPWIDLGPEAADWATRLSTAALLAVAVWRLRPWGASVRFDPRMVFGVFVLLALLIPSICWDHYGVIALWPLFACWTRIREADRLAAAAAFALLAGTSWLPGGWIQPVPFVMLPAALAGAGALIATAVRRRNLQAAGWALAGVLVTSRVPHHDPLFQSGPGLLVMSLKLWGLLLLFGMTLAAARRPEDEREEECA